MDIKEEHNITKAFRDLFLENGKLKPEAEIVLAYLRDESGGRGELENNGSPFLYDKNGRFDMGAAAYLTGRRRMFDLIVKHLALDEIRIFNLLSVRQKALLLYPQMTP